MGGRVKCCCLFGMMRSLSLRRGELASCADTSNESKPLIGWTKAAMGPPHRPNPIESVSNASRAVGAGRRSLRVVRTCLFCGSSREKFNRSRGPPIASHNSPTRRRGVGPDTIGPYASANSGWAAACLPLRSGPTSSIDSSRVVGVTNLEVILDPPLSLSQEARRRRFSPVTGQNTDERALD